MKYISTIVNISLYIIHIAILIRLNIILYLGSVFFSRNSLQPLVNVLYINHVLYSNKKRTHSGNKTTITSHHTPHNSCI